MKKLHARSSTSELTFVAVTSRFHQGEQDVLTLTLIFIYSHSMILMTFLLIAHASDFHSPRTAALGGAGHASPFLHDAIYLNPAYGSFHATHSLGTSYYEAQGGHLKTNGWNTTVLDASSDALFQAGVGFTRREDVSMLHVGASKSFLTRYGGGIGGKCLFFPTQLGNTRINDLSLSIAAIPLSFLQLSFTVDNVLENARNYSSTFLREYVLGSKWSLSSLITLYIDPHLTPGWKTPLGYEMGAELTAFQDFYIRFGSFREASIPFAATRGNGYAAGLGWLGPKLSIDYASMRLLEPIIAIQHTIGIVIFF